MCHVTIVELIKLKILLDFLFIDIIQYKKYRIIKIKANFSLFFLSNSWAKNQPYNDPRPL